MCHIRYISLGHIWGFSQIISLVEVSWKYSYLQKDLSPYVLKRSMATDIYNKLKFHGINNSISGNSIPVLFGYNNRVKQSLIGSHLIQKRLFSEWLILSSLIVFKRWGKLGTSYKALIRVPTLMVTKTIGTLTLFIGWLRFCSFYYLFRARKTYEIIRKARVKYLRKSPD